MVGRPRPKERAINVSEDLLTPLVTGITQGSIYGLLGLGLVLLYKSNRIFNFTQGEFGSVAAFTASALLAGRGFLPEMKGFFGYGLALLIGLLMGILLGLLVERLVVRPLFGQPKVTLVVATAGVSLLLISIQLFVIGVNGERVRPIIAGDAFSSGGLRVTWQQVIVVCVLGALAAASALFFKKSRLGTAIIAVSQEPTATSLVGISVNRVSAFTWAMAGGLGAIAGLLLAPTTIIAPGFMTNSTLIPAFTAAVLGGIASLPGAFVGGIAIGIIEQFGAKIPADVIPGGNSVVVFVVLLAVLLVRPAGLLGKEA
jgi:branched-chain amino acid transport system permease protein